MSGVSTATIISGVAAGASAVGAAGSLLNRPRAPSAPSATASPTSDAAKAAAAEAAAPSPGRDSTISAGNDLLGDSENDYSVKKKLLGD